MQLIRNSVLSMGRRGRILAAALALGVLGVVSGTASAALSTVSIATTQLGPTTWKYSLTLGDALASTTPIGTLWYGWVPGEDFLTTNPSSITTPAGWTNPLVLNDGAGDGYSIQWDANSTATDLQPGQSLSGFSFESSDPPSSIFGDSVYYPGTPTSTFFTYSGEPFDGTSFQGVGTAAVPEPVGLAMLAPVAVLLGDGGYGTKRELGICNMTGPDTPSRV